MSPEVGIEGVTYLFWDGCSVVLHAKALKEIAGDARSKREDCHYGEELEQRGADQVSGTVSTGQDEFVAPP